MKTYGNTKISFLQKAKETLQRLSSSKEHNKFYVPLESLRK